MRNGSIVLGESTFKSRLTSLNEGKPYYFFLVISYSRRRVKADIYFNVHFGKN